MNTYNILPWCRLDYLGLRRQCVRPLLWQIDPNYGILWQPVCHFCVGSVPIAVLVILHFPVLVCSIFNRVLFGCYLRTAVHNILFLVSLYLWHTSTSNKISTSAVFPDPCDHTWECKEALSFPNALDCVPKAFSSFCNPMPAVGNIDHWVIFCLGLPLLFSWHHLTRLPPLYAMFQVSGENALVAIGSDMPTSYATWDIRSVDLVSWCGGW